MIADVLLLTIVSAVVADAVIHGLPWGLAAVLLMFVSVGAAIFGFVNKDKDA